MKYKGFFGSVEFSIEDKVLHGKIECINDLITYEATSADDIEEAFHEAVEDYIETCELVGKEPEKPMAGTFNVRIGPELHKAAYLAAKDTSVSLNDYVKSAISEKLETRQEVHMHVHWTGSKAEPVEAKYSTDFGKLRASKALFALQTNGVH